MWSLEVFIEKVIPELKLEGRFQKAMMRRKEVHFNMEAVLCECPEVVVDDGLHLMK